MKKIAIIGGGAAGAAALLALSKSHDVVLFEANDYLGGHAYTHEILVDGNTVSVDMGVEYFHERLSPNLTALLNQFNLRTYIAPLSFRAFNKHNSTQDYWSNTQIRGKLNHLFHEEMNCFHLDMLEVMQNERIYKSMSMSDFLALKKYSEAFQQQALLPLLTTFSGCKAPSLEYSLMYIALSFNMNLLSFFTPSHWRKISGGIHRYYQVIYKLLKHQIYLNTPVHSVEKKTQGVELVLKNNQTMIVDDVIFACQAEIANSLIKNPTFAQHTLLSTFESINVHSTLHTDFKAVSNELLTSEYCQFELLDTSDNDSVGYLTRVNNNLYPYQSINSPLFVSFDMHKNINPAKVITSKQWKLPKLRPEDLYRKSQVRNIQGVNHMWFCGTDYSYTGHEGALVSGLVIADHLGGEYLFPKNGLAKAQFNIIKNFMGVYSMTERLSDSFYTKLYTTSKRLKLHEKLAGRFVKDLLF